MRVLVVGGYGFFGGRLVRLLARDPRLEVIAAGRSQVRAEAFCASLGAPAVGPACFDRGEPLEPQLAGLAPEIVIDASGPFQAYGADPYALVRASLAAGAHYLDLADATAFVAGVGRYDAAARASGRVVLSGLSTVPALSGAALRAVAAGMDRVDGAWIGIAPSPFAGLGLSVVQAICGYAGHPVPAARPGGKSPGLALVDTRLATVAPPGAMPLRARTFSLIQSLSSLDPPVADVWTAAGTAPEILHRALNLLARLVFWRLLSSLAPLAGLFHQVVNRLRWGEHRGGMIVEARGLRDGRPIRRGWHLIAEGDDGPFIPVMAAAAVVAALARGEGPSPGARSAGEELSLADFEPSFRGRAIESGLRDDAGDSVFRRVLGDAFEALPPSVRGLHDGVADAIYQGRASVERGGGLLGGLIAVAFGFPGSTDDVPARVDIRRHGGRETWRRTFDGRSFHSVLSEGRGRWAHLLEERFGPVSFAIALVLANGRLNYVVRGWNLLGVRMPGALAPGGVTFEHDAGGRFGFDVEITLPLIGRLVRYRGWFEPAG